VTHPKKYSAFLLFTFTVDNKKAFLFLTFKLNV